MAEVLGRLGAKHIMVVHSADGLDEISIVAETHVAEFKNGKLKVQHSAGRLFLVVKACRVICD